MRNITFDESSVLREFARIAVDKGLVKVAQELPVGRGPAADPTQLQQMPAPVSRPGPAIETSKHAPAAVPPRAESGGGPLAAEAQRLVDFSGQLMQKHKGNMPAAKRELDQHILASANKLRQQYGKHPAIDKFQQELMSKLLIPQVVPAPDSAVAKKPAQADDQLASDASTKEPQVKQAKDESSKYYDVTGETGEDLVEQAHPGGGTYTELTHSKTKENLVETIVEQQEADLAVARKAPKGTYAALVNLYNTLTKMGHEDKLNNLKTLIAKVATVDEVLGHTLVSLADKLDTLGYRKVADEVDTLLKKKD